MPSIRFFSEDIKFSIAHPRRTATWIKSAIQKENKLLGYLNFIFCSDRFLHRINVDYLNHDTYTDIVTFGYSESEEILEGDIFISIDRVRENALRFKTSFDNELYRVMIHGVLHLIGYSDKNLLQKTKMKRKEDTYLTLR